MKELITEVAIDASANLVFHWLTDLDRYKEWNPLIVKARGRVAEGEKLDIVIRVPGQSPRPYIVRVVRVIPGKEFVWRGHMKVPGLLDGTHVFEIFPESLDRVRLVHREEFRGIFVPFVWSFFLDTHMRNGFEALNLSLKALASNQQGQLDHRSHRSYPFRNTIAPPIPPDAQAPPRPHEGPGRSPMA